MKGVPFNWFHPKEYTEILSSYRPDIDWLSELNKHIGITKEVAHDTDSHLGIFDFQDQHFFMTNPPTLFDGYMRLEPRYFDLALTMLPHEGYQSENAVHNSFITYLKETEGEIDIRLFTSALWMQTYRKAANFLKNPNEMREAKAKYMIDIISSEETLRDYVRSMLQL